MVKKFTYKGKTIEEIKSMSLDEFMKLVPSRERRSLKRGFSHEQKNLLKKLEKRNIANTKNRELVIIPSMVGKELKVHNGKEYVHLRIGEEMIGKRLGEFVPTRKSVNHSTPGIGASKSTAHQSKK